MYEKYTDTYKGTQFQVMIVKNWNTSDQYAVIEAFSGHGEEVFFRAFSKNNPVTRVSLPNIKTYPDVKKLHFPKIVKEIELENTQFPNLEQLFVDDENPVFSSDGRILYSDGGSTVYRCLVDGYEPLSFPDTIDKIDG